MIETSEFRRVVGHFPSGVTVVTSCLADGEPRGLTVNAFCSVSLMPPLVLVCIENITEAHACILRQGAFAVNVLDVSHGEALSRRFADPLLKDQFEGVAYRTGRIGAPLLDRALAWVECQLTQSVEAGDHSIFIGEVLDGDAGEGHPLLYYRGGYGRFDV